MRILIATLSMLFMTSIFAHTLTSDKLDPNGTFVIITVDGIDDLTCGPATSSCIGGNGAISFSLDRLTLPSSPYTVTARLCNAANNCSPDSEPITIDPATFSLHRPTGLDVIEIAP